MIIITLTLMLILLIIGVYYKLQNNKYENNLNSEKNIKSKVRYYSQMRTDYPNLYFFKIKLIKRKIEKGKNLSLYEKEIMKDLVIYCSDDIDQNYNELDLLFDKTSNNKLNKEDTNMMDYNDMDNFFGYTINKDNKYKESKFRNNSRYNK